MFRKLRRRLAKRSIRKFFEEFLPNIGLGDVHLFECVDFRLGDYAVCTSKGRYKVTFWELVNGAKEIILVLRRKGGEGEFITFSIEGKLAFDIMPETHTIDRNGTRQVVDLITGNAKVYPKNEEEGRVNYTVIEYKQPIMESQVISIDNLIKETYSYIF